MPNCKVTRGPLLRAQAPRRGKPSLGLSWRSLHGPAEALASAGPRLPGGPQPPPLFSRFVCTPLSAECPATGPGTGPGPEELLALRSAAAQLRRTALEQKERIRMDQETIRELTGKLSRCEGGLRAPPAGAAAFSLFPPFPLGCGGCQVQQELPARTNGSAPTAPALARDALHTKMEQLEEQLLSKILTLQKERQAANTDRNQHQHDIEKELSSLQNRVTELEHGESCPAGIPPDAFKVTIPVQNNYMYARMKKSLPELYAFTICMWLKSKALGGLGTPFSYSVTSQSNEIVLLEWGSNPLELLINDKVAQLPLSLKDKAWHHVCVAWTTRDGKWSAYQDGEQRGAGENLASWHAIKPQGVIILGQEQDTLGGRFDATQAFVGELAQFSVWDHMLAPAEILALANCTSRLQGNVIQWDDQAVEVFGGASKGSFAACEEGKKA
uniref:Neuronal pentraxin receptor n=1 Tax=Amazona collaria TaxID=241587 RepID=A0A8B9FHW8_9PSIT